MRPTIVYWALTGDLVRAHGSRLDAVLDVSERERARSFRFAADREAFVAAHALLRFALSAAHADEPQAWCFAPAPGGRPELTGPARGSGLRFSLAHARSIVACAVAHEAEIGVDVEEIPDEPPDTHVLEHCCAPFERTWLRRTPDTATAFARLWTLKEAVLKAQGTGLAVDPRAVVCALDPARLVTGDASAPPFELTSALPTPRHALGVACSAVGAPVLVRAVGAYLPGEA